ncbi:phosphate starvation-inducible protein PhoH [Legionella adelaidensis]|uniref:PhoH-like protein n=1 Tax=Legionella adelaidensis TaxID=45056 RepID=A0A0W0R594_9GAMM|nr:PhoH family protein [Legionella adelaidensis]KTC66232.1 phosphate starvation-inducible protein PhoH [Legionella adelaidensis]
MSSRFYNDSLTDPTFNSIELANLCGVFHQNIHLIEKILHVQIKPGQDAITLIGHSSASVDKAKETLIKLHPFAREPISPQMVMSLIEYEEFTTDMDHNINLSRKVIHARNIKQAEYLKGIDTFDLNFAIGPAGTGKTYLAVAKAIEAFEKGEVQRLVFVRPAVEAGEKLGFLPGDLVEKVLPYLRPIYDALYEMIGFKEAQKLIQSDVIEVLPLAFMRGRTLNEAFIILDEAQNTTVAQMKMFLTRIGFGSKTVVTGDATQVDLPKGTESGLIHAVDILKPLKEIGIYSFTSKEVVRHPLVSRIIDCYDMVIKDK